MNVRRIERAITAAKRRIALRKLGWLKNFVFYDKEKRQNRLVYHVYVKKGEEKTPEQQAEIDRIEAICKECDIDAQIIVFIDDLGDEFLDDKESEAYATG